MVHAIFGIIIDEDYSKWFHLFLSLSLLFFESRIRHNFYISSMRHKYAWILDHTTYKYEWMRDNDKITNTFMNTGYFAYNIKLYCFAHKFDAFIFYFYGIRLEKPSQPNSIICNQKIKSKSKPTNKIKWTNKVCSWFLSIFCSVFGCYPFHRFDLLYDHGKCLFQCGTQWLGKISPQQIWQILTNTKNYLLLFFFFVDFIELFANVFGRKISLSVFLRIIQITGSGNLVLFNLSLRIIMCKYSIQLFTQLHQHNLMLEMLG